jgi:hypothetical protein
VAFGLAATAHAHEPFEITTDAHIGVGTMDIHVLLAVRTAARVCLPDDADQRRLVAGPPGPVEFRAALEDCARKLYDVTSDGQPLPPREARVVRTQEDDLDVRVMYPEPPPGILRFTAVHLGRLSDPTYGATLTVTAPGAFLGQKVLRASDSTFQARFEPAPAPAGPPTNHPSILRRHALAAAGILVALGVGVCLLWKVFRPVMARRRRQHARAS